MGCFSINQDDCMSVIRLIWITDTSKRFFTGMLLRTVVVELCVMPAGILAFWDLSTGYKALELVLYGFWICIVGKKELLTFPNLKAMMLHAPSSIASCCCA
jgi:hypothetical protein